MAASMVGAAVNATLDPYLRTETFESETGIGMSPNRSALISFITMSIIFAVILFGGKWLWNNVLHELVPAIKPAKSIWQILGLAVLIMLLNPGSCNCA